MILTVCCNPCIDEYLYLPKFKPEALNRVTHKSFFLAGKGINVAKSVARLGENAIATGFMFANDSVKFTKDLSTYGVASKFVELPGSARVNLKIIDSNGSTTELNDNSIRVSEDYQLKLIKTVKELATECDFAVFSGSLPLGVEKDFYCKLAEAADIPFAVDAEGDVLSATLPYHPVIVKPNIMELEQVAKRSLETANDLISAARELIKLGTKYVLVSRGKSGAIIVSKTEAYSASIEGITQISPTGAGDAMLAAAVIKLIEDAPLKEVVRASVAAGTAAVLTAGTLPLKTDAYNEYYKKIEVIKI